jgi:hypothetical protein
VDDGFSAVVGWWLPLMPAWVPAHWPARTAVRLEGLGFVRVLQVAVQDCGGRTCFSCVVPLLVQGCMQHIWSEDILLHAPNRTKGSSAPLAAVVVCLWDKNGAQVASHTERCVVDRCCGVAGDSGSAVVSSYHCCTQFRCAPR